MLRVERAALENLLGEGLSLAEIGRRVGRHEATVAYWVGKHGLRAVNAERHLARGPVSRAELEGLTTEGLSIAEIAKRVGRSKATVRHWLTAYDLRTARAQRLRRSASGDSPEIEIRTCPRHGRTEFKRRHPSGFRCLNCRSEAVASRRRRIKLQLVEDAGGACSVCGYDRCVAALAFHHLSPADKRFGLSGEGVTRSLAICRLEAGKCALLCANCHAEVEAGMVLLA